VIERE
jgi:hypothetical protein